MVGFRLLTAALLITSLPFGIVACSTMRSVLATDSANSDAGKPIVSPFGEAYPNQGTNEAKQPMILRTKKGDRAVEIELPRSDQSLTDFVIPVAPSFREMDGRSPASTGEAAGLDESYKDRAPGISDREIAGGMTQGMPDDGGKRREIEQNLGLIPSEDGVPPQTQSYLAAVDKVKQLYRLGRYEAALIEVDALIVQFPTDAKLYAMRGTLLDRIGKSDLALQSWNQALRFNPSDRSLKRFLERRQQRMPAGGAKP